MKKRGNLFCLVGILLCVIAGSASSYTVAICTDGFDRGTTNPGEGFYEYSSAGALLPKTYRSFLPNSRRWWDLEYKDGILFSPSFTNSAVYNLKHEDGTWPGIAPGYWYDPGGNLNYASDCEFSPDGSILYVVSQDSTKGIARFNTSTGAYIDSLPNPYSDTSNGISIGPDGNLYVTTTAGVIRKWDTSGNFLGNLIYGLDPGLTQPKWHNGDLYVAQGVRVFRIGSDGTHHGEFVLTGAMPAGDGMATVSAFDWTPDGDLLVAAYDGSASSAKIYRFNGTTGAYNDVFCDLGADTRATGIAIIPEPATMALLLAGLPLMLRKRRRG